MSYNTEREVLMDLKKYIRDIPDFPQPGILFKDITPLLQNPDAFNRVIDNFRKYYSERSVDAIVAIEARGFLFGAALAYSLRKPLIPVRKRGKLPFMTHVVTYSLEYGSDAVEIHKDGIGLGQRVVIVDDVLATGGTVAATSRLVKTAGGVVDSLAVVIELMSLMGRTQLEGTEIYSIVQY